MRLRSPTSRGLQQRRLAQLIGAPVMLPPMTRTGCAVNTLPSGLQRLSRPLGHTFDISWPAPGRRWQPSLEASLVKPTYSPWSPHESGGEICITEEDALEWNIAAHRAPGVWGDSGERVYKGG